MRTFEVKSVYDSNCKKWLEAYFIDNREVEPDEYFANLESEEIEKFDDYSEDTCDGCCDCCDQNEDEEEESQCQCEECQEERLVEAVSVAMDKIMEVAEGCPDCILNALFELATTMHNEGFRNSTEQMKEFLDS
jgi:hypothetical protein